MWGTIIETSPISLWALPRVSFPKQSLATCFIWAAVMVAAISCRAPADTQSRLSQALGRSCRPPHRECVIRLCRGEESLQTGLLASRTDGSTVDRATAHDKPFSGQHCHTFRPIKHGPADPEPSPQWPGSHHFPRHHLPLLQIWPRSRQEPVVNDVLVMLVETHPLCLKRPS